MLRRRSYPFICTVDQQTDPFPPFKKHPSYLIKKKKTEKDKQTSTSALGHA